MKIKKSTLVIATILSITTFIGVNSVDKYTSNENNKSIKQVSAEEKLDNNLILVNKKIN